MPGKASEKHKACGAQGPVLGHVQGPSLIPVPTVGIHGVQADDPYLR